MIRTAFEFIKGELDAYISDRENDPANYSPGSIVEVGSVVSPFNNNTSFDSTKHITITLIGVEEERREGKRPYMVATNDRKLLKLNPPVELNLLLLFIAHSADYSTALRDLSDVAAFFQANTVFDEQHFPNLNATVLSPDEKPWQLIERLSFRLHNLSFEQQNNLWGMFGSKYVPSVIYKMSLLTVLDTRSREATPAIVELGVLDK
ncbi:DUF4255 domain-containing protein [Niabella soli]|uniref:Pvc16 N-terminal domain-containing protein n=1 Tax=Niabella soli DSM 19437 TaxID=929713 RepID=W0F345_9BACT|nr:DUF4255 domain-containing protein [Niabella soli]AHF17470.1 hypothetical protein NIASO_08250 [Niabella soli DSM 19437]